MTGTHFGLFAFMEFIKYEFKRKQNPSGIYKVIFDDKHFYIGSSIKLKSRMSAWRARLFNTKFLKSKNISLILPSTSVVKFEIVEIINCNESLLREKETILISDNWDNPLFLNRCPDSNSPKNMRPYIGYTRPIKKVKPKSDYIPLSKPVALFNNDGNLIKVFHQKHNSVSI